MKPPLFVAVLRREAERSASQLALPEPVDTLTTDAVLDAFRATVRRAHPDVIGPAHDAAERIARAKLARDLLLRWIAERPDPLCKRCHGSGHVPIGPFSSQPCPVCGGE